MNLVDSSAWIEYFVDGKHASKISRPILQAKKLIIPTIVLYEVFRYLIREASQEHAWEAISVMHSGEVVELTTNISLQAAQLGLENNLAMADSIILATARDQKALIWTLDSDFKDIEGVKFFKKS